MRILFTGATSLAAQAFLPALRDRGHQVTAVSRRPLSGDAVVADLKAEDFSQVLPSRTYDVLVHFGSCVPIREKDSTWEECSPANIYGTRRLLEWADGRIGRLLLASSCAVYGSRTGDAPVTEDDPLAPETFYALTKYAQEQLVSAFCLPRAIPFAHMRIGYVYGPGMPEERAVMKFVRAVQHGKAIRLVNARSAGLPLVHVEQIAFAGLQLLDKGTGAYNIVGQEFLPLCEFVEAAMRTCASRVQVTDESDPQSHRSGWFSLKKVKDEGLYILFDLEKGIRTLLGGEAERCRD